MQSQGRELVKSCVLFLVWFEGYLFINAIGQTVVLEIRAGFSAQLKNFVVYNALFFFLELFFYWGVRNHIYFWSLGYGFFLGGSTDLKLGSLAGLSSHLSASQADIGAQDP